MTLPLYLLLIPYAIFLIFFVVFSLVNLYHVLRFGSRTFLAFAVTFLYLGGTVLIVAATYASLQGTDWSAPLLALPSGAYTI